MRYSYKFGQSGINSDVCVSSQNKIISCLDLQQGYCAGRLRREELMIVSSLIYCMSLTRQKGGLAVGILTIVGEVIQEKKLLRSLS